MSRFACWAKGCQASVIDFRVVHSSPCLSYLVQDIRLWLEEGQAVDVAALPFTPIVLVNASASAARERRCLTLPPGDCRAGCPALQGGLMHLPLSVPRCMHRPAGCACALSP